MKLGFSQQEIIGTAKSLGLPTDGFIQRRIARAYDLVESNKVSKIDDGIFRVRSQYEPSKSYIVNVNHGAPYCDCPDGERTINCKHRIASLLYQARQAQAKPLILKETTDDVPNQFIKRSWFVLENGNRCLTVVEELNRLVFCNCGAHYDNDCIHKQAVIKSILDDSKRIANECGSAEAKALQDKLNGQLGSQKNSDGRAQALSSQPQLDQRAMRYTTPSTSNPFEESESYDIDQIEGRRNGELAWKLSNGEYVISYKGIMTLAEKHNIEFSVSLHDDTNTVIAKAMNGSERVSGKPIYGLTETAIELAKRNAARQLLPYAELKAVEKKFQLESEFSWEKAYRKSCEAAGGKPQCDIVIHELVKNGKLRQASCFEYNRIEWRLIYETCKRDAQVERDPKSLNRWSYNSAEFLEKCREVINQVRESKKAVEANEMPLQTEAKRKLQMDKKLNTWLVEADGTKTPISCREICEQFESKEKGIIKRLRAGIDSGADISTVELN